jgi:hypothetical protein
MGRRKVGFNSFKRELGKNAGKAFSNWIFGDSHSTPYRVKIQREKTKQFEKKAKLNEQRELIEFENEIQKKILLLSQKKIPESQKKNHFFYA